jgi:type IV secretion system protein VirB6
VKSARVIIRRIFAFLFKTPRLSIGNVMANFYKAPVQGVIDTVTDGLSSTIKDVSKFISDAVTPLVATCFGIYMILTAVNYMRGATSEPVFDFWLRIAGFSIIIGLGLNMENYNSYVVPIVISLGNDLANAISGGNEAAGALDQLIDHYKKILDQTYRQAAHSEGGGFVQVVLWAVMAAIIVITLIPFVVLATVLLVTAIVGSVMIAAVGPIFFGFMVFPATRQYFSAWLNSALSYALIPLFTAVIAMMSVNMSKRVFNLDSEDPRMTFEVVFIAGIINLILMLLLKTVSSLASSLSAGGVSAGSSVGGMADAVARKVGKGMGKAAGKAAGVPLGLAGRGASAIKNRVAQAIAHLLGNDIRPG